MLKLIKITQILILFTILLPVIDSLQNITQLNFTQSASVTIYSSKTILPQKINTFTIKFLKTFSSNPAITIGVSQYKGSDESRYEDFYIEVDETKITITGCLINFKPGMSTSILILRVNYIVVDNKYKNWYTKNYVFNSFQLFIGTGPRAEKFGPYNISKQFNGAVISSVQSNNKIFLSETGYQFTTSLDQKYDNLLSVSYINKTFYITASTTLGGSWTQINFQATLIVIDLFPSNIKLIMSNSIITPDNLIYDITQPFGQNNILGFSKVIGYNGFMAKDTGILDYSWTEKSSTSYEYSLGNLLEARAVFMAVYNQTEIPVAQVSTNNNNIILIIVIVIFAIVILSIVVIYIIKRLNKKIISDYEKKNLSIQLSQTCE